MSKVKYEYQTEIASFTDPRQKPYKVSYSRNLNRWLCACKGWIFRTRRGLPLDWQCKHILAAIAYAGVDPMRNYVQRRTPYMPSAADAPVFTPTQVTVAGEVFLVKKETRYYDNASIA